MTHHKTKDHFTSNKLSSREYYHPDSLSFLTKSKNNTKSQITSKSHSFLTNSKEKNSFKNTKESDLLFPSINKIKIDKFRDFSGINQTQFLIINDTEREKKKLTDETMNEVLLSLQNMNPTTNPSYLNDDEFLTNRTSKKNIKKTKNKEEKNKMFNLNNRLAYLDIINPNPDTAKLPKIKKFSQLSSVGLSKGDDDKKSKYFQSFFISSKHSKSLKSTLKPKIQVLKQSDMTKTMFFSEINVEIFLNQLLQNISYLTKIKNNQKIVAGILKNLLEFTDEIGMILLTENKSEVKKDLDCEKIKEKLLNKTILTEISNITNINDDLYDMNLLVKLYFFNSSLTKFIQNLNNKSSEYQNEIYTYGSKKLKEVQEKYLNNLKNKNFEKYERNKNMLNNNQIYLKEQPFDILKNLEDLENSIGKLPLISPKTRLICQYVDNLYISRKKLSII